MTTIIAHFDGHGVCSATILKRILPKAKVICEFPKTSPEGLPDILKTVDDDVIIVDIAVNVKDPEGFVEALKDFKHKIIYFDEHDWPEIAKKVIPVLPNVTAYHTNSSYFTSLLPAIHFAYRLSREEFKVIKIGAVCDRDSLIPLAVTSNDIYMAYAVDKMVREGTYTAIDRLNELIDKKKLDVLIEEGKNVFRELPVPSRYVRTKNIIFVRELLLPQWASKVLEKMTILTDVPFAVGYGYNERFRQYFVTLIQNAYKQIINTDYLFSLLELKGTIIKRKNFLQIIGIDTEKEAYHTANRIYTMVSRLSVRESTLDEINAKIDTIISMLESALRK